MFRRSNNLLRHLRKRLRHHIQRRIKHLIGPLLLINRTISTPEPDLCSSSHIPQMRRSKPLLPTLTIQLLPRRPIRRQRRLSHARRITAEEILQRHVHTRPFKVSADPLRIARRQAPDREPGIAELGEAFAGTRAELEGGVSSYAGVALLGGGEAVRVGNADHGEGLVEEFSDDDLVWFVAFGDGQKGELQLGVGHPCEPEGLGGDVVRLELRAQGALDGVVEGIEGHAGADDVEYDVVGHVDVVCVR